MDGIAAALLEPYFEGGRRGRRLDPASRSGLEAQARRLDELINGLNGEAAVYFGRLRRLIALALVDQPAASATRPGQPGGAPGDA